MGKKEGWEFRNTKNAKNRGGNFETPKNRKQKKVGITFFRPIDRGFNGSRFILQYFKGEGLEMGGNVESQKRNKKGDGNIEIQKNGKKQGVGLLRHRKKSIKREVKMLRYRKIGSCGRGTKRYGA